MVSITRLGDPVLVRMKLREGDLMLLGDDLLSRVCSYLNALDTCMLMRCCQQLWAFLRSDRIWKRLFLRKFYRKPDLEELEEFLGSGYCRLFKQESFFKEIGRIGKTLEVSQPLGDSCLTDLVFVPNSDNILISAFTSDWRIAVLSVSDELKTFWVSDTLAQGQVIETRYQQNQKREDLGKVYANELFRLISRPPSGNDEVLDVWSNSCKQSSDLRNEILIRPTASSFETNRSDEQQATYSDSSDSSLSTLIKLQSSSIIDFNDSDWGASNMLSTNSPSDSECASTSLNLEKLNRLSKLSDESETSNEDESRKSFKVRSRKNSEKKNKLKWLGKKGRTRSLSVPFDSSDDRFVFCIRNSSCFALVNIDAWNAWHLVEVKVDSCRQLKLIAPPWSRSLGNRLITAAIDEGFGEPSYSGEWNTFMKTANGPDLVFQSDNANGKQRGSNIKEKEEDCYPILGIAHSNGTVSLWSSTFSFLGEIFAGPQKITLIILDKGVMLTGHENGLIQVWDSLNFTALCTIDNHIGSDPSSYVSLQTVQLWKKLIFAGGSDGWIYIWDYRGVLRMCYQVRCDRISCIRVFNTGFNNFFFVCSGGADGSVSLRKMIFDQEPSIFLKEDSYSEEDFHNISTEDICLEGHSEAVRDIFVDDYKVLSCGDDGKIKIWNICWQQQNKYAAAGLVTKEDQIKRRSGGIAMFRPARTIKWKRRVPIRQLLAGPDCVFGLRSDDSIVGFTFNSQWPIFMQSTAKSQSLPNESRGLGSKASHSTGKKNMRKQRANDFSTTSPISSKLQRKSGISGSHSNCLEDMYFDDVVHYETTYDIF